MSAETGPESAELQSFDSCYYCLAAVEKCGSLCDACQAEIDHARDLGSRDRYAE